ncbi:Hypothetical_protein [Hexamita inflata]|uniref:Hypothetical_protein n=1 Tax=Hexamita inflata TaxID=28002 RepID=A0AA86Q9I7_9EUKA|nr:Hypothetical protein HINF_LOCUS42456 [Hexamita inflata]
MKAVNEFAVFGLSTSEQEVYDCLINVSINLDVVKAALICQTCDVQIQQSTLIFVASGVILSGVLTQSMSLIQIKSCSIQHRFNCNYSAGIVSQVYNNISTLELIQVNLSGYNQNLNSTAGYFSQVVTATVDILFNQVQICASEIFIAENYGSVTVSGQVAEDCNNICASGRFTYGLCLEELLHSSISDGQNMCVDPFEFLNDSCVCKHGYILNQSQCINVINSLLNLEQSLGNNISAITKVIDDNRAALERSVNSNVSVILQLLQERQTQIEYNVSETYKHSSQYLKGNISSLEQIIMDNYTQLNIIQNQFANQLDLQIQQQYEVTNNKISNFNISAFNKLYSTVFMLGGKIEVNNSQIEAKILDYSQNQSQYLYNKQKQTDSARYIQIAQLDQYIYGNITNFINLKNQLHQSLTNRLQLSQNYIKNNYSQLLTYIQNTYANYTYLKALCNPGVVCGSQTSFQKRSTSCPEQIVTITGQMVSAGQTLACRFQQYVNYDASTKLICTATDWSAISSCTVPSTFTYGGTKTFTSNRCTGMLTLPLTTIDLCRQITVNQYQVFDERNWSCSCQ